MCECWWDAKLTLRMRERLLALRVRKLQKKWSRGICFWSRVTLVGCSYHAGNLHVQVERDERPDWVQCGPSLPRVDQRDAGKTAGLWAKQGGPRWRWSSSSRTRRRTRGVVLSTAGGWDQLPTSKRPTVETNQKEAGLLLLAMSCLVLNIGISKPVFPHSDISFYENCDKSIDLPHSVLLCVLHIEPTWLGCLEILLLAVIDRSYFLIL